MSTLTSIKMGLLLIRIKLGSIFTTDKSYPKDPDPKNWRTIRGAKVHLSNGKIDGGAGGKFMSNAWVGKEKHGNNSFFPLSQMNYKKGSMGNIQTGIKKATAENERNSNPQTNKNHAYWNAPQGKAEANVNKWFDAKVVPERVPEFQRKEYINTMYAAMRKKALSLNSEAAGVNQKIDRINNKREKLTEEDQKRIKELRAKAKPLELEANYFVKKMNEWKNKYHPEEPELFQRYKLDPNTNKMEKIGNVSGQQPEEKQYYSPLEAVAKLREMRKAKKTATEKPKSTAPKKKGNARTRLEDVAKEVGINLEEYRTAGGKYDKRNSQNIKFEDMPKEKADAFKQALREKGYTLSWNGGLGTAVKEPQERKATANYKPTEKTAAPEGYEDYLKRKNSGQKNSYEEGQEARRERYENRSAAASKESEERFNTARGIQSNIPLGQPILVGHHSEARHRADIKRIENNMNKAFEASKKADYYSQRAESVGSAGISSLDPDAKYKVYEKLRDLENLQDKMKEANAKSPNAKPYASYQLVNNGAEIRRLKKRLEDLSKASTTEGSSLTENSLYSLKWEEGRYQFKFDGKPSDEVRSILKSNGFKWSPSRGTWVRSAAGSGSYAMERVKKALEPYVS